MRNETATAIFFRDLAVLFQDLALLFQDLAVFFRPALRRTAPWSPWTVDLLHAGVTLGIVLAVLLLVVFVRRRMRPAVAVASI